MSVVCEGIVIERIAIEQYSCGDQSIGRLSPMCATVPTVYLCCRITPTGLFLVLVVAGEVLHL